VRTRVVGNPVRAGLLKPADRAEARRFFRLRPEGPVCLCLGGSQGAQGLNRILFDLIGRINDPDSGAGAWQLLWSTGPDHFQSATQALRGMEVDPAAHSLNPFIEEMALAYAAADVVVARAGALTLAELTALGLPSVLVPLPTAAGGHQARNARALERAGAAEVIEQADPRAAARLETLLAQWAARPDLLAAMARAAAAQGRPQAGLELAQLVLDLLPGG
jgi:UDP-N-acetylglucosamine--N-acetylmuramyl-(pentapeptide) pyrophosphoryl-undecaprenol N-acetylglucosamine transferase